MERQAMCKLEELVATHLNHSMCNNNSNNLACMLGNNKPCILHINTLSNNNLIVSHKHSHKALSHKAMVKVRAHKVLEISHIGLNKIADTTK
jgi:hypothetical protein